MQGEIGAKIVAKHTFGSGFRGQTGKEHFERRQSEGYSKDLTQEQYEKRAHNLLQKELGGDIAGYETKSGKVVRWDKSTNDYAVGMSGERIKTMFPLRGGQDRFDKLRALDSRENGINE